MVPTLSELFCLKHFGAISSFMMLGNPIGVPFFFLFSSLEICFIHKLQSKETLHVMVQIAS
jgi:hypothetical protein